MRLTRVLKGSMSSLHQKLGRPTLRGEVWSHSLYKIANICSLTVGDEPFPLISLLLLSLLDGCNNGFFNTVVVKLPRRWQLLRFNHPQLYPATNSSWRAV